MYSVYLSGSAQEHNAGVDGIIEEDRMQALVKDIAIILRAAGIIVYVNDPNWTLKQIIADSNNKVPNLHLALHSNAGGAGTGTETWCYKKAGTKSSIFGKALQIALVSTLGLHDRGIKDATIDNNIGEVLNTHATAVLTELFFHDNMADITRFTERRQAVVEAIANVVLQWFGIKQEVPKLDYKSQLVQDALDFGWIKERRDPTDKMEWWEGIQLMKNVMGR